MGVGFVTVFGVILTRRATCRHLSQYSTVTWTEKFRGACTTTLPFQINILCTYFNQNPLIHISNTPHSHIKKKKDYKTLPAIVQQLLLICNMIVWASMKRGITRKNTATTYWVKNPKIVYAICRIPYLYYIWRPCPMRDWGQISTTLVRVVSKPHNTLLWAKWTRDWDKEEEEEKKDWHMHMAL